MQSAGAAEAQQAVAGRVVAALHRDDAQGARHVFVDDIDYARGGLHNIHIKLLGEYLYSMNRCRSIQFKNRRY